MRIRIILWIIVAIAIGIILGRLAVALIEASPVLFGVVISISCGAMWFFWLEPLGASIKRDVFSHLHETDD
jgi:uncharacterized membrane protein YgaE (UPF0421/DUF939 family)